MTSFESHPWFNEDTDSPEYNFKIVFIGDSGVGKSKLTDRFKNNQFLPDSKATVGVDFSNHVVKIDRKFVRLTLWDTAGQERYRSFASSYFKDADGIFLVFDLTNPDSFDSLEKWIELANSHIALESVSLVVLGNKKDLEEQRKVSAEIISDFVHKKGFKYFETSALLDENNNVCKAMQALVEEMMGIEHEASVTSEKLKQLSFQNVNRKDEADNKGGCC